MLFLDLFLGAIGHDAEVTRLNAIVYGAKVPSALDSLCSDGAYVV